MKHLSLIQRFSLLCLAAILVVGSLLGSVITRYLEQDMLMIARRTTANFVHDEVKRENFFATLDSMGSLADYIAVSNKVKHFYLGPDIVRIKIWDKDRTVRWSDDINLVGRRFLDNEQLEEALRGEVVSEIVSASEQKAKYRGRGAPETLMELYIPIRRSSDGEIEYVFEMYQSLDPLYTAIERQQRTIWTMTVVGFALLYLILFAIFWQASRLIQAQTESIRQSEERYRRLVESAMDGIIGIDRQCRCILLNEAAEKIFGYQEAEMIGQPVSRLIAEDQDLDLDLARFFEGEGGAALAEARVGLELDGRRKDGNRFPLEISLSASGAGPNAMVTAIVRDVSEKKAMQEQLIEAAKQATTAVVSSSIGHELGNVVTALQGYAELLLEDPENVELAVECAETYRTQCRRLDLHSKNLLALGKPREPQLEPFCLNSLLRRVTDFLQVSGVLKRFDVRQDYAPDLPAVLGDEVLFEQVIMNIEINAAHALAETHFARLEIRTRRAPQPGMVELTFADNGPGIPEELLDKVLQPFFTTKETGTGLGLFIVQRIVEQHHGRLELHSTPGQGLTVTITLPTAGEETVSKCAGEPDQASRAPSHNRG
jgi:PAS domain S-box-containing protein